MGFAQQGVPALLVVIGAAILLPTLTIYSACGFFAQFFPLDCWASTAASFIIGILFIVAGVLLFIFGPRD